MARKLILILEDDDDDKFITSEYFSEFTSVDYEFVSSSDELSNYLSDCLLQKRRRPSLLLLNYNSYPKNAPEILSELRQNDNFKNIPVVVLSGVVIPGIVKECYEKGANSFIQKPARVEDTHHKITTFLNYWFWITVLPE